MVTGLVSTIIPVYNRADMLCEAVQSVLDQTYRPIEIIIIDDGSTDDTKQTAQNLSEIHPEIKLISIVNSGPGIARETGRQIASGEFIQYLDSDDLLQREKFSTQVSGLNESLNCGVSYCVQYFCDMEGTILDDAWMRSGEHHTMMFPAMLGGRLWGTPAPLYRSALLKQCGPWLDLKSEEDWEYDCRIASQGVSLHYAATPLVIIRTHNNPHFGQLNKNKNSKMIDRTRAYQAIYKHAIKAKIHPDNNEFQKFFRMTFKLSRTCGAMNLIIQAQDLFKIASQYPVSKKHFFEYKIYKIVANIIGWSKMGRLSIALDKWRS